MMSDINDKLDEVYFECENCGEGFCSRDFLFIIHNGDCAHPEVHQYTAPCPECGKSVNKFYK